MRFLDHILLVFTIGATLASTATAQTPTGRLTGGGKDTSPEAGAVVAISTTALNERRFEIQFEQLPLAEAMEILRGQLPDLNVVVPPSLADAPIGPLKLRNVTLDGFVRAIPAATDGQVEAVFDGDAYLTFARNPESMQQQSICRILSLREYLAGKEGNEADRAIAELTDVVTMACNHLENARQGAEVKTPRFSVHPATKLLIAVGSPEAVAIVEEVVGAVTGVPSNPAHAGPHTGFGSFGTGGMGMGGFGHDGGFPGGNAPPGTSRTIGPNTFNPATGTGAPSPRKPATGERR